MKKSHQPFPLLPFSDLISDPALFGQKCEADEPSGVESMVDFFPFGGAVSQLTNPPVSANASNKLGMIGASASSLQTPSITSDITLIAKMTLMIFFTRSTQCFSAHLICIQSSIPIFNRDSSSVL